MRAVLVSAGRFPRTATSLCSSHSYLHRQLCKDRWRYSLGRSRSRCTSSEATAYFGQGGPADAQLQASSALSLVEWDVVVYDSGDGAAIGRIAQLRSDAAVIDRLEEEGESLWAVSDRVDEIPLQQVRCVLEADYMQLCDPDRISNPHGEHAYEVFRLLQAVPPGVWGSLMDPE